MLHIIHLSVAIIAVLLVLYSDEQAFMWVFGKTERMDQDRITLLHRAVTGALALLIATGGLMYYDAALAYLSLPTFLVKMAAVFALILNTYAIYRFSSIAVKRSFASLSYAERMPLLGIGAISIAGWTIAFVCGLVIS